MKLTVFLLAAGFVLTAYLASAHNAPGHKASPIVTDQALAPPAGLAGARAVR
jgi:hypothetical protein